MSIRIFVDQTADAAYIQMSENDVARTVEFNDEVFVDLDDMNMVVGVELLQVSAEIPFSELVDRFHVHSEKVELLRLLRPSISQSVISGANDGVSSVGVKSKLETV